MKEGKIRADASQSSGWLVIIGHLEYGTASEPGKDGQDWKVGAYEPCTPDIHDDTEYIYTVDVETKTVTYRKVKP